MFFVELVTVGESYCKLSVELVESYSKVTEEVL